MNGRSELSEFMEVEETERVVIVKPVASRPNCSRLKSFSELLAGAIDSPCSTSFSKPVVAAIRPKTIRFRPVVNQVMSPAASSQAEIPRTVMCDPATEDSKSQGETTMIYKPKAKFATRSPISLSVNLGSFHTNHRLVSSSQAACIHDFAANLQNSIPQVETDRTSEPSLPAPQCLVEEDNRSSQTASNADSASYDGYNWRKYGQKQVKGSEYPRSYYKCTHPNCPVKKKVERSFDSQITEIVYKGEHSHAKPQPPKRGSLGTHQVLGPVPDDSAGQSSTNHLGAGQSSTNHLGVDCIGEGSECSLENRNKVGSSMLLTYHGEGQLGCDPDSSCEPSGSFDGRTKGMEMEDDRPRNKRRKSESPSSKAGISGEGAQQDDNVVVQSSTNTDLLGDGFRWRKYGQKVVKGSPYPRSYYRCTSLKCNVRKHVERASDDPTSFVTTYEGKHNHKMPTRSRNPSSDHH